MEHLPANQKNRYKPSENVDQRSTSIGKEIPGSERVHLSTAQCKLQELADNSPQVRRIRTYQQMADSRQNLPIQMVSAVYELGNDQPVGYSAEGSSTVHAKKEDAQNEEDKIMAAKKAIEEGSRSDIENRFHWNFIYSAEKHQQEEWCTQFGLTSNEKVKEAVLDFMVKDPANRKKGKHTIVVGTGRSNSEHKQKPVTIIYEVSYFDPFTLKIFHCGPSDQ
jgi:hypothetical protein